MNEADSSTVHGEPLAVIALLIAVSIVTWNRLLRRRAEGLPLVPYEPRRRVPWQAPHAIVVLAGFLLLQILAGSLVRAVLGPAELEGTPGTEHFLAPLIVAPEANIWTRTLAVAAAVVAAPIVEELVFRLVLQGWLEAAECRWRRRLRAVGRLLPRAVVPLVLTAALFAALHGHGASTPPPVFYLVWLVLGMLVASALVAGLTIALLRYSAGATLADLGWQPEKLWSDVRLGLIGFAAVAGPIYVITFATAALKHYELLPPGIAFDPFPLFFFALGLGILYWRTHRIVPAIVMHAALNATSVALALAFGP